MSSQEIAASWPLPRLQNEAVLWPTPCPGAGTGQPRGWRTRHTREGGGAQGGARSGRSGFCHEPRISLPRSMCEQCGVGGRRLAENLHAAGRRRVPVVTTDPGAVPPAGRRPVLALGSRVAGE